MNRLKEAVKVALVDHETVNTQERLADFLGMSASQFSRALNNNKRSFTENQRFVLAGFLGVTASAMTGILRNDAAEEIARQQDWSEAAGISKIVELQTQMQALADQNKLLADQFQKFAGIGDALEKAAKTITDLHKANIEQAKLISEQARKLASFKNDASGDGSATQ